LSPGPKNTKQLLSIFYFLLIIFYRKDI